MTSKTTGFLERRSIDVGTLRDEQRHAIDYACVGHPMAKKELADLRKIAEAASAVVKNPVWAGICDEDIDLEQALRAGGWLERTKE